MLHRLKPLILPVAGFVSLMGLGALAPALNEVLSLALPFFGLILLGYVCGKLIELPEAGLAWMNAFIIYVALPALFFNLVHVTPVAELANWRFILITTACTGMAFGLAFVIGLFSSGKVEDATIQGVAGGYSNVGYMGPGLTLATFGPASVVPTALIFVFDSTFFFTIVPVMMALAGSQKANFAATAGLILKRVLTHPFNIATAAGVAAAALHFHPPAAAAKMLTILQGAAAPCALFVMGVTVALRPLKGISPEMPLLLFLKLIVHPLAVWFCLSWLGHFDPVWTYTAVLMAALPPALNVFVMANQYGVYVQRASGLILIGTIVSVVTVTGLLYFITASGIGYRALN